MSRRKGLATAEDADWRELDTFATIYRETMARNRAAYKYDFSAEDFTEFRKSLAGHAHLLVTRLDGEVAAAGIFTEFDGIVQAHLVASRASFRLLSPTKVLLDDARRWSRERGDQVLHLGGGRGGSEDSLFRFKSEFSSQRHGFFTGRWVLDERAYQDLVAARRAAITGHSDADFFPEFLAPVLPPEEDSAGSEAPGHGAGGDEPRTDGPPTMALPQDRGRPPGAGDVRKSDAVLGSRVAGPNVLITSAGRRVGLVRAFQKAVEPLGGRVIATDHRPGLSAACQLADAHEEVPRISHPEYFEATRSIAQAHGVGLVIPALDLELAGFAAVRDEWASQGVLVHVSDADLVAQCRDKRLTGKLFESLGVPPCSRYSTSFPGS